MTEPSVYHSQGYNCAEALIKSYNEEHNTDIPSITGECNGNWNGSGKLNAWSSKCGSNDSRISE